MKNVKTLFSPWPNSHVRVGPVVFYLFLQPQLYMLSIQSQGFTVNIVSIMLSLNLGQEEVISILF